MHFKCCDVTLLILEQPGGSVSPSQRCDCRAERCRDPGKA